MKAPRSTAANVNFKAFFGTLFFYRPNSVDAPSMSQTSTQSHLGEADQAIADFRTRIAFQKTTIDALVREGHSPRASSALLAEFEEALQQMLARRDVVRGEQGDRVDLHDRH